MASKKAEIEFDAIYKARMEKDLQELQLMIQRHFEQRKIDDEELKILKERIAKRKSERERQILLRQMREKERMQQEKDLKEQRLAEEKAKKDEEEERKKAAMIAMTANKYGGYLSRDRSGRGNNKRTTEREKKRRALAERKQQLSVDHMKRDNLLEKLKQLWSYLYQLEEEKFDFEDVDHDQKYDISQLRGRVTEYMAKQGKGPLKRKTAPKTLASVGSKMQAFK